MSQRSRPKYHVLALASLVVKVNGLTSGVHRVTVWASEELVALLATVMGRVDPDRRVVMLVIDWADPPEMSDTPSKI